MNHPIIPNSVSNIWKALNNNQEKPLAKTFNNPKKDKIFTALSTPKTLQLKARKTQHYWNQLEQFMKTTSHEPTQNDQKHYKQTQIMAQNHYNRRKLLQTSLKQNVLRQILKEGIQRQESKIKLEQQPQISNIYEKEQKVNDFVKRQQFKARQTLILKQMRQFLQFGAIRK